MASGPFRCRWLMNFVYDRFPNFLQPVAFRRSFLRRLHILADIGYSRLLTAFDYLSYAFRFLICGFPFCDSQLALFTSPQEVKVEPWRFFIYVPTPLYSSLTSGTSAQIIDFFFGS